MPDPVVNPDEILEPPVREEAKDEPEREELIEGERGAAELLDRRRVAPPGSRVLVVAMGVVVLVILAVLSMKAYRMRYRESPPVTVRDRIEKRVPALEVTPLPPAAPPVGVISTQAMGPGGLPEPGPQPPADPVEKEGEPPVTPPTPPAAPTEAERHLPTQEEIVQERRLSRGFGAETGVGEREERNGAAPPEPAGPAAATVGGAAGAKGRVEEKLEAKLEATELKASTATVLRNRDYTLTEGAVLDCVLETRIVSTAPGMTSCHLTRDVYSTSGRVVLLDRGSLLVGRYQGGMQQGDSRIFVVWTRAETPAGVVVRLDSPGTGALGEAGAGGWVDTHFWDRFGAAILVSLIGSGADAVAARAAGPSRTTTVSIDPAASATKDVVARTYDNTINMPPTLYVNQGERIGIFVARDLDFRGTYGLERVDAPRQ